MLHNNLTHVFRKVCVLSMLLCLAIPCFAQTLDECQALAREHYPQMRQYNLVEQTKDYNLSALKTAWLPQVNLSAQATLQNAVPSLPEAMTNIYTAMGMEWEGLRKDQYRVQLDVHQLIWDGGATKAAIAAQNAEAQESLRRTDVDIFAVEQRINDLYFGLLLLNGQISQMEQTIETIDANLRKLKSYVRNGAAMQADADAAEAQLLTVRQQLAQMNATRQSYEKMLSLFTGKAISHEGLSYPSDAMPEAGNAVNRPELRLLDATVEKLEAKEKQIKASVMPAFSAFASGFYGYPGYDYFDAMQTGDMSFNGMVGIRMNWNISAFYNKKSRLGAVTAARQMAEVNRDVFLFNNDLQTSRQYDHIATLRSLLSDDERILTLRSNVRKAAETRLDNGVIDATDLLAKISDENVAALTRNSREIELLKAIYELKHTLAQ